MDAQRPAAARPVEPSDRFYARAFAIGVAIGLGYLMWRIVSPFLGSIIWAMFIAFLVHPVHVRLTRRLRNRPQTSAAILTVATLIVLVGPLTALSAAFVTQAGELVQQVKDGLGTTGNGGLPDLAELPAVAKTLGWLHNTFGVSQDQLHSWTVDGARSLMQILAALGGRVFLGAVGTVVSFGLTLFMLYFFIRDGVGMLASFRALIPMNHAYKNRLFDYLAAVTRAVVYGTGMTAVIQGTLVGIAFLIAGLPSAIVFGVLAALSALLPFAGAALVWAPAAVVLAIEQRWGAATFMLIWGVLVVSLVDNIVRPLLVSGRARIGTLTVFIGVLGGVSTFGAIGLVMGPLVVSLALALLEFMREIRSQEHERRRTLQAPPKTEVTP
jgi:predicted PurR-regulated permease PerM